MTPRTNKPEEPAPNTPPQASLSEIRAQATIEAVERLAQLLAGRVFSPRITLLSIKQVCEVTRLGRSTIYDMVRVGTFPEPQRALGKNLWRESTLIAWCERNDPNIPKRRD